MQDGSAQPVSRIIAVKTYFFADGTGLAEVAKQWKDLSETDKQELAEGAARELGVELKPEPLTN